MRNGQNKRMRGRNRRGHNPLTRVYESNGPDVKIRGTAHHVAEKYMQLARDAQASGDPVAAEGYFQHAEHYFRLIAAAQAQFTQPHQQQQSQFQRPEGDSREDFDDDDDDTGPPEQPHAQPYAGGAPVVNQMLRPQPQPQPPQPQPQPPVQGYPQQPRNEQPREGNLPAFITGGAGMAGQGQGPGQGQGNGMDNEPGDRDGGRFGRRRRRFRPRGPGEFEPRAESAGETSARPPVAPPAAANETRPGEGGVTPPKPVGSGD